MMLRSREELIECIERNKKKKHVPQLILAYKQGQRDTIFGQSLPPVGNYMSEPKGLSDQELLAYDAFWASVSKKCPVSFTAENGTVMLIDHDHRELLPKGTVHASQVRQSAISLGASAKTALDNNEHRKTLAYRLTVVLEWGGIPKITRDEYAKLVDDAISEKV